MSKAYQVVRDFEKEVASWSGAKYGVAVESCCAALFLCLKYFQSPNLITIPKRTYIGVAMAVVNSGNILEFSNEKWKGSYQLKPLPIVDSALCFKKDMYYGGTFRCLSFHAKKHLPIGRGGMILTDDKEAVKWFKMARFDGRKEKPLNKDNISILGWNMYMTPEQAARGLMLFDNVKNKELPDLKVKDQNYPDLSKFKVFK